MKFEGLFNRSAKKPEQPEKDEIDESKRRFLRGAGAVAAAAVVSGPTSKALANLVETPARKFESIPAEALKPEYERQMKEVFLVLTEGAPEPGSDTDEIIKALPSYTRIRALIPKGSSAELDQYLVDNSIENEFLHTEPNLVGQEIMDHWAQDFGSGINLGDGRQTMVTPSSRRWNEKEARKSMGTGRNERLRAFTADPETPLNVIEAPFIFHGGNVFFDRDAQGKPRVLAGFDTLIDADDYKKITSAEDLEKTLAERKEVVSRFYGGAEVLVMGDMPQTSMAFHIDQSFTILPGMRVVLTGCEKPDGYDERNPVGADPHGLDRLYHQQQVMHKQLQEAGYTVHVLKQDIMDSQYNRFSVNGSMYRDAYTGQLTFIQPVFDGQHNDAETRGRPLTPEDLNGTAKDAYELFTSLGAQVKLARNSALGNGNVHCMLNQLA